MNARVTILSADDDNERAKWESAGERKEAPEPFDGVVTLLEQPQMELSARQPVPNGAALRIDTAEAVWLGDAERVTATGDDYLICVRLRHVLRDFETLARLAERFSGTAGRNPAKEKPVKEQTVVRI